MEQLFNTAPKHDVRISVIIPVYNRESVLERAVLSALNQTFTPIEIIIVDNNSTDNSPSIIKQLTIKYPLVKSYKISAQGASHARNEGLLRATGNWIQFLDSDDVLMPEKFKEITEFIFNNPDVEVIYTPHEVILTTGFNYRKRYIQKINDHVITGLMTFNVGTTSSNIFKKSIFENITWNANLPSTQDYDLFLRLFKKGNLFLPFFKILTKIYADFRVESLSRPTDPAMLKTILENKIKYLDSVKEMLITNDQFSEALTNLYLKEKNTAIFQFLLKASDHNFNSISTTIKLDMITRMRLIYHHVQLYYVRNKGVMKYPEAIFHSLRFIRLFWK